MRTPPETDRKVHVMPLSPAAAAKKVGVSRSLISRALKDGELRGTRKNNGHWSIDQKDLEEWMGSVTMRAPAEQDPTPDAPADDLAKIAGLEVEVREVRAQLAEAKSDRDAWREQAQKLASESRPAGLFARLFGR